MECDGSILNINQFTALFTILGISFGGNATQTFALPDLRGKIPIGSGQGTDLHPRAVGETGGTETYTLSVNELPPHVHSFGTVASLPGGNLNNTHHPIGNYFGVAPFDSPPLYGYNPSGPKMAGLKSSLKVENAGLASPAAVNNQQPYLPITFAICVQGGPFPSRI